jgi:hypothetical protein
MIKYFVDKHHCKGKFRQNQFLHPKGQLNYSSLSFLGQWNSEWTYLIYVMYGLNIFIWFSSNKKNLIQKDIDYVMG